MMASSQTPLAVQHPASVMQLGVKKQEAEEAYKVSRYRSGTYCDRLDGVTYRSWWYSNTSS